jgi:hypothetical protein
MKMTGSGPTAGQGRRRAGSGRGGESSDASLAEQEVPDRTRERRRGNRRGHGPSDELHQLQIGMIEGWVSEGTLRRLAELVDRLRPALADPDLDAVLDDVERRAVVELATLSRGPA